MAADSTEGMGKVVYSKRVGSWVGSDVENVGEKYVVVALSDLVVVPCLLRSFDQQGYAFCGVDV